MGERTEISWADSTFNPWTGCTKVGPGCDHCYAETLMDTRFGKVKWGSGQPRVRTSAANWREPLKWNARSFVQCECGWRGERDPKGDHGDDVCPQCGGWGSFVDARRRVFCASLADVFDNEVATSWRVDLFDLIRLTPNLTWLLLTKRVGNVMTALKAAHVAAHALGNMELAQWLKAWIDGNPPEHVYLGITVVDQPEADRDIVKLLAIPAAVRFLSIEPMLGPINIPGFNATTSWCPVCRAIVPDSLSRPHESAQHGAIRFDEPFDDARDCSSVYDMIHWTIAGGESGHNARPMHPEWARSIRDQCAAAGVPFLFKQWGEWVTEDQSPEDITLPGTSWLPWAELDKDGDATKGDQTAVYKVGKHAAGRKLDGIEHNGFPA